MMQKVRFTKMHGLGNDYIYVDGKYVLLIQGELTPASYIHLVQVNLKNNEGRIVGSGGAVLTGVADGVNLMTKTGASNTVSIPTEVVMDGERDMLGMRFCSFGIPGCNPYDQSSVTQSVSEHCLVLNVIYANNSYKNISVDLTEQVRALPLGGVIVLDLDVNDFPPEGGEVEGSGFEALIRWKKDNFNRLMPDDFIPIFERDGCIVKMDYYVYDQVFRFVTERLESGKNIVPVSVNVSIVHFYDNKLIPYIDELLEKYKVKPELIYFEIDERIAVAKLENVSKVMNELQERGFRVYIDNFGSGYSALNTFTKFHPNGIKIGRSLMKTDLDINDKIIIKCVVNMGNKLNLEVVAEGVENEEQFREIVEKLAVIDQI